jgi:hypothetical protein
MNHWLSVLSGNHGMLREGMIAAQGATIKGT